MRKLNDKEIQHLVKAFTEACKKEKIKIDFKKSTPGPYDKIASVLCNYHVTTGGKGMHPISGSVLIKLLHVKNTKDSYQIYKLNVISKYLSKSNQNIDDYLRLKEKQQVSVIGTFIIYWNSEDKVGSYCNSRRKLVVKENSTIIISPDYEYNGWAPRKIGKRIQIICENPTIEEVVYIDCHIGDIPTSMLNYIPGILLGGDITNTVSTARKIMLLRENLKSDINHNMMISYFSENSRYQGNITSWAIKNVEDFKFKKSQAGNLLSSYYGKCFKIYHYKKTGYNRENKKKIYGIERSMMIIENDSSALTIHTDEGRRLEGTFQIKYNNLKIYSDNLDLIFKIPTDEVPEMAIGVYSYISPVSSFLTSGIAVFELVDKPDLNPKSFPLDLENFEEIPENIFRYLNHRYNNYVKTPDHVYSSIEEFSEFFVKKKYE